MKLVSNNGNVLIRNFTENDLPKLVEYVDNKNVSKNLRDAFPSPYTLKDAWEFYEIVKDEEPRTNFAIEIQGEYAGNIGLVIGTDVYRNSAELGFFIGEPHWNKGITSQAVNLITKYAFEKLGIVRIFSIVFEYNVASQRVLEKCGFEKEAIFKKSITKKGIIYDEIRYSKINPKY